jgi:hypothetical protein
LQLELLLNGVSLDKFEFLLKLIQDELPPSEVDETPFEESFNGV